MSKVFIGYQGDLPVRVESSRDIIENDIFLKCDRIEEHEGRAELVNGRILFGTEILTKFRTAALSHIDSATSAAILAGFEYTIDNEILHFSYDSFDQQNFADTANGALLVLQNVDGVPSTVEWNGYRNYTKEQKGELVRLVLDVPKFLDLYIKGALVHKNTQMELGGKRKAIISNCTTVESIEMYMKSWYGE